MSSLGDGIQKKMRSREKGQHTRMNEVKREKGRGKKMMKKVTIWEDGT